MPDHSSADERASVDDWTSGFVFHKLVYSVYFVEVNLLTDTPLSHSDMLELSGFVCEWL